MAGQPSPEAREDYNALLESLMPFAEQMLKKHGEFFPFGAAVRPSGEVAAHEADLGQEQPPSEQVVNLLVQAFQNESREGKVRAVGICFDGRITQDDKPVDAVILNLEHVSGHASKIAVPYTKGFFGKLRFGEMIVARGEPQVFGAAG